MSKNIKQTIEEFAKPIVEQCGYEYVETDFSKQGKDWVLTIYIDSPKGIELSDCEKVSRLIDPVLDEKDPIEQSYCLCVSSIGLDKPLKTQKDFDRNMGKCIDIKLYKPVDGKKLVSGRLKGFDGENVTVETENEDEISVNVKDAAKITLHIDF